MIEKEKGTERERDRVMVSSKGWSAGGELEGCRDDCGVGVGRDLS